MIVLDVLYVALATIAVMLVLQIITFLVTRMMYPPEPKVVYMQSPPQPQYIPQPQQQPTAMPEGLNPKNGPVLTQPQQEVQLPEYEPRKPASSSLRLDTQLPDGIQETRPEGL
jgi:hypothetical protein